MLQYDKVLDTPELFCLNVVGLNERIKKYPPDFI